MRHAIIARSSLSLCLAAAIACLAAPAVAGPRVGDKAPAFTLKSVDKGEPRALGALGKGKTATVVFFHSARCPFVKEAQPVFADLVKTYGAKVAFVGINSNQNEPADEVKKDAAEKFAGVTIVKDDASKTADAFDANHTPEAFLVDATGVIRYHGSYKELGAALGELTGGKPVSRAEVKALGCTIKRKP